MRPGLGGKKRRKKKSKVFFKTFRPPSRPKGPRAQRLLEADLWVSAAGSGCSRGVGQEEGVVHGAAVDVQAEARDRRHRWGRPRRERRASNNIWKSVVWPRKKRNETLCGCMIMNVIYVYIVCNGERKDGNESK